LGETAVQAPCILTPEHRSEFERAGVLHLPGFYSLSAVAGMADALWDDLGRRFGMDRRRPETWTPSRPAQFQDLQRSGAFSAMDTPRLAAVADALLGEGRWVQPRLWGQPLVTFPTGSWDVPHQNWHLDLPAEGSLDELDVIRVFTFLEPVRPRGGGTLYIAGSHRVVIDRGRGPAPRQRLPSSKIRALLQREEPWFAALLGSGGDNRVRRFMSRGGVVRGVRVHVEEMTGDPGDLVVMHPATFHTIAPNGLDRPRMMLVQSIYSARSLT
jgi:ectoine hydroxylase-related dioxygenase (phytanoyl-CoA dioxygenase family)